MCSRYSITTNPEAMRRLFRFLNARRRSARSNFQFDLEPDDIPKLWRTQHERCAVSGLRFRMARFPEALVKHPYGPSLDRIDSRKGYVRGNVRLVCTAVNFGLGQWGDEVFRTIAEATVHRQATVIKEEDSQLSERIQAAEAVVHLLSDVEAQRQRRRIAALKRARTLGPEGRSAAAKKAWQTRNR